MTKTLARETLLTGGLDVGDRSVKIAILSHQGGRSTVLAKVLIRIQGRPDARADRIAIRESWGRVLADAGLSAGDIDYVASTGTRDRQLVRVGHYYQRSSHALGAQLLFPDATAALDIGSDQIRCALSSEPRDGRRYAATRQEAGYGREMLEAIARRMGVTVDEASVLPEAIALQDDLAARALKLLRSLAVDGKTVLTGGMVLDAGLVRSLWRRLLESGSNVSLLISPEAIFAGAYGAAILAARRFLRVSRTVVPVAADPLAQRILRIDRRSLN
jgi:benzoyl-CoA reductase subunit D